MTKLTNHAPLLRAWFPTFTEDEHGSLLWNCTAFPCGGEKTVREQLNRLRVKVIRGATLNDLLGEADSAVMDALAKMEGDGR